MLGDQVGHDRAGPAGPAAPLVQERMTTLVECVDMLGFLFVDERLVHPRRDRRGEAAQRGRPVGGQGRARRARRRCPQWTTEAIDAALRTALVEELGLKPRNAFGPVRVAVTGRRVSPPLFESLELLGRERSLARLASAQDA